MRSLVHASILGGSLLLGAAAQAATVNTTVDGRDGPWLQALNPSLDYGVHDNLGPTVVSNLVVGETYTISASGFASAGSGFAMVGPGGDISYPFNGNAGSSGKYAPSKYIPSAQYPAYLMELIGAFADGIGAVQGSPFAIGTGASFTATATTLLLGINDDIYDDNTGSFGVSVSGTFASPVPLPASAPLFGAALVGLGVLGYGVRRKSPKAA